jgi:hypothetical protein
MAGGFSSVHTGGPGRPISSGLPRNLSSTEEP